MSFWKLVAAIVIAILVVIILINLPHAVHEMDCSMKYESGELTKQKINDQNNGTITVRADGCE
jgi:protein tyrosine phosphatase